VDEKHKLGGYLLTVYELLYLNNNFMQSIFHETETPHIIPKASSQPTITPPTNNTSNNNTTGTNDSDLIISSTVESMGNVTISDNNNNAQNIEQNSTGEFKNALLRIEFSLLVQNRNHWARNRWVRDPFNQPPRDDSLLSLISLYRTSNSLRSSSRRLKILGTRSAIVV
jgi:hypothetical protein